MKRTHDVIVLGAGAAGLAAAQALSRAGLDVAVLEARDRLGGRVHTLHDGAWPHPIELGAEFAHGVPRKLHLPARFRLGLAKADGEHWVALNGRLRQADEVVERAMELPSKMQGAEQSAEAFLRSHPRPSQLEHALAREFINGFYAADPKVVSTRFLAEEAKASESVQGETIFRATAGYDVLMQRLARTLDVRRSTAVTEVRWSKGTVTVRARHVSGEPQLYRARRVVVALPLGVLRSKVVRMSPTPEALSRALTRLTVGNIVKVVLLFREPFWEHSAAKTFGFVHAPRTPVPVWWRPLPFTSNVLVGWVAGAGARKLERRDEHSILRSALRSLEAAFHRSDLTSLVDAWRVVNWARDPFARGGYMVVPVGALGVQHALSTPIENTVFLAGEHTESHGHAGTVHGAVWTGERAARDVLKSLNH